MKFLDAQELRALYGQSGAAQLRLNQPLQHRQSGDVLSSAVGDGLDYWDSRPYQTGDDPRHMDWRLSARTGEPYQKRFLAERRPSIVVAVDRGRSMRFGTQVRIKAAQAHRVAALLAMAAVEQGWVVDHYHFDQGIEAAPRVDDRLGLTAHLAQLVIAPTLEQPSDLAHTLHHLASRIRPGTPLYVVSDFFALNTRAEARLAAIAAHCTVIAVRLFDPAELTLPQVAEIELNDGIAARAIETLPHDRARYAKAATSRMAQIEQTLTRAGCQVIAISTIDAALSAVPLPHGWGQ
ncbi:MAG: DUF58 domain-containing protein [Gammaproteobacteria bacterium]|nr:DUF58 domain-containing protein [Gammaproteobacteria bacterium]